MSRTVEWNYEYSYLDKVHLFTEDEESVVPAVAEQDVVGVVTEEVARLVDMDLAALVSLICFLSPTLQINSNHFGGGGVSRVDSVVFFHQEPDVG